MAAVHHTVELGLNACGVECCPHAEHRDLVAVASYLHQPGDDDEPQSRVGQLYLYACRTRPGRRRRPGNRRRVSSRARVELRPGGASPGDARHLRAPMGAVRVDRSPGPVLAQADAGGFLTLAASTATERTKRTATMATDGGTATRPRRRPPFRARRRVR